MGYNTTVLILNDGLDQITRYPEQFVEGICTHIARATEGDVRVGNHANPAYVMRTEHADVPRLYYTHGNSIIELSPYAKGTMEYLRGPSYQRDYVISCIKHAERQLRELRKVIRDEKL